MEFDIFKLRIAGTRLVKGEYCNGNFDQRLP